MRIDFQKTFDLSLSIANANFRRVKNALLLGELDGLRFKNKNAFLTGALRTGPTIAVRLNIDDERGAHLGR
jgi:hypothetical protein